MPQPREWSPDHDQDDPSQSDDAERGRPKNNGALDGVVKEAEVEAALTNCRKLMKRIDAGLSVKKLSLNISLAAELLFFLEFAASLSRRPHHAHESVSRRSSPSITQ